MPFTTLQQTYVLFCCDDVDRGLRDFRRNDHFHKLTLDDRSCGFAIQLAVKGNDAAKCRGWVGLVSAIVSLQKIIAQRYTTWVRVFHNHTGWLAELFDAL
ncbi:Uncharacterised protein [Vibrio cholerae]|nr:Uncharacterised protein [Vibrio cholerae]